MSHFLYLTKQNSDYTVSSKILKTTFQFFLGKQFVINLIYISLSCPPTPILVFAVVILTSKSIERSIDFQFQSFLAHNMNIYSSKKIFALL